MESHHPPDPSPLSEHPIKDPAPADDAEPKPRRARKPVGWSMIFIGALVAVCAGLVWRRDGIDGVLKILTHDLWLFGEIMPRVLAGCLLGALHRGNSAARKSLARARAELRAEGIADRHGVRRDPARRSLHRLSGGGGAAHRRRRFRRHHRHGGELDADRLRPRGRLGIADPRRRLHAVADRDLAADPGSGRRARPLRLSCGCIRRASPREDLRADHRHHPVGLGR